MGEPGLGGLRADLDGELGVLVAHGLGLDGRPAGVRGEVDSGLEDGGGCGVIQAVPAAAPDRLGHVAFTGEGTYRVPSSALNSLSTSRNNRVVGLLGLRAVSWAYQADYPVPQVGGVAIVRFEPPACGPEEEEEDGSDDILHVVALVVVVAAR